MLVSPLMPMAYVLLLAPITTDHGSEFGTDFSWHLQDLGITHRYIARGNLQSNGKVERTTAQTRKSSTAGCVSGPSKSCKSSFAPGSMSTTPSASIYS